MKVSEARRVELVATEAAELVRRVDVGQRRLQCDGQRVLVIGLK